MNSFKNCSKAPAAGFRAGTALPYKRVIILAAACAALYSCGPSHGETAYAESSKAIADSVSLAMQGLATDTINGVTHNFIRTADLKFKVKSVLKATENIEDLVRAKGGYVSLNDMHSETEFVSTVKVKQDSVMEVRHYTTVNFLTIRVPNRQLDTVLRSITGMAQFIDYNKLTSDDVKMKLYGNHLAQNRNLRYQQRVEKKTDNTVAKLKQNMDAEDKLLEKQALADEKSLESYDLADQVNYSTVRLQLYQPAATVCETTLIPPAAVPFEPSFASKLGAAFLQGFSLIQHFVIFLVESWGLILILVALYVSGRRLLGQYTGRKTISAGKQ